MRPHNFAKLVRRAVKVAMREMRDGCVKCLAQPGDGFCFRHHKRAIAIILHPEKSKKIKELLR